MTPTYSRSDLYSDFDDFDDFDEFDEFDDQSVRVVVGDNGVKISHIVLKA